MPDLADRASLPLNTRFRFLTIPFGKLFDDGEDGRNMAERRSSAIEMGNCSVSGENAKSAGLKYAEGLKRVHLCKEHYRQFKKETKKDRVIESLGRTFGR
jgi:hypothetical protein